MVKLAEIKNVREDLRIDLKRVKRNFFVSAATQAAQWVVGAAVGYLQEKVTGKIAEVLSNNQRMATVPDDKFQIIESRPPKNQIELDRVMELVKEKAGNMKEMGKELGKMEGGIRF